MYKVGDYVTRVEEAFGDGNITKGNIYKLERVEIEATRIYIYDDNGKLDWFVASYFELAEDYILKELWKE